MGTGVPVTIYQTLGVIDIDRNHKAAVAARRAELETV
jgi:hypothetical protein